MSSIWKTIHRHLKEKGFDVYAPATKLGECVSPYIVVKNDGGSMHQSFSTDVDLYSIMCYVSKSNYCDLEEYVQSVKLVMKELYPMIIATGAQTSSYYDDGIKAHMISVGYKNYKKN